MQRKLSVRIIASLILSVMLFALPVGAFIANSSTAVSVFAEESVSDGDADAGDSGSTDDGTAVDNPDDGTSTDNGSSENGNTDDGDSGDEGGDDETDDPEPTPEPEPECICDHKCSQYDYSKDCPVCSADYTKCAYVNPSVKITINAPTDWYSAGTSAKVRFKVEDIADSGHFAIKSVKAKIGQNGSYHSSYHWHPSQAHIQCSFRKFQGTYPR